MRHLMADVDASNNAGGADLAILGGQRQRYRYFGYENGGVSLTFAVNKSNLRHGAGPYEERIALMPVEKEDTELMDLLYAFYQQGQVTGRKREEFFEVLSTWKSRVLAAYYDMDCIGYLVVSEDGSRIVEIKLTDMTLLPKVLQEYMMMYYDGWNVQISVKAFETEMIQVLSDLAEECSVGNNLQYKIYNWPKVLRAFLNLKNSHEPLEDGCLIIDIKDTTRVQITVKDGIIAVEETDQPAEISLEPTQAVHLLTSPAFYYTPIPALKKNHWFPLTFAMSNLDEF